MPPIFLPKILLPIATMPITCPITFPRLSTEEFRSLDYKIMGLAFACHKEIGRLADESVYQADLAARLVDAGYRVVREVPVTASFRTFVKHYFMDIVVADNSIYELKAVAKLNAQHEAQLMNYLLMVGCSHGKVINFHSVSVESRFVNAPMTIEQRRSFEVNAQSWDGDTDLLDCAVGLLRDWGTCLELPLYYQGLIHLLGGDEAVTKLIPLKRGGISLGNQRFHLQGQRKLSDLLPLGRSRMSIARNSNAYST